MTRKSAGLSPHHRASDWLFSESCVCMCGMCRALRQHIEPLRDPPEVSLCYQPAASINNSWRNGTSESARGDAFANARPLKKVLFRRSAWSWKQPLSCMSEREKETCRPTQNMQWPHFYDNLHVYAGHTASSSPETILLVALGVFIFCFCVQCESLRLLLTKCLQSKQ